MDKKLNDILATEADSSAELLSIIEIENTAEQATVQGEKKLRPKTKQDEIISIPAK
jgi:hypothetical protein